MNNIKNDKNTRSVCVRLLRNDKFLINALDFGIQVYNIKNKLQPFVVGQLWFEKGFILNHLAVSKNETLAFVAGNGKVLCLNIAELTLPKIEATYIPTSKVTSKLRYYEFMDLIVAADGTSGLVILKLLIIEG